MQYSRRFPLKTLEELTPKRQEQVKIATNLEDMVLNSQGWKVYEAWLEDQYLLAVDKLKTCEITELIELQVTVKIIEDLKMWMTSTIEKGRTVKAKLLSEDNGGKVNG